MPLLMSPSSSLGASHASTGGGGGSWTLIDRSPMPSEIRREANLSTKKPALIVNSISDAPLGGRESWSGVSSGRSA